MAVERVKGVREAEFSYERAEGFVTFDTTQTTPEAFIAELERMTDYSATLRPVEGGSSESAAETADTSAKAEPDAGRQHSGNG